MATKPTTTGAQSLLDQYKAGKTLTLQQQTQATTGMTSSEKYAIAQARGNAIQTARGTTSSSSTSTPPAANPKSVAKPSVTSTSTTSSGATPPSTSTTSSGSGSYGQGVGNAYSSTSTTTVPMNVGGVMKDVPISEALKLAQGGSPGLSAVIQSLRAKGQISKSTNKMSEIAKAWSATVNTAARAGQNPFDYLNMLPDPPSRTNSSVAKDGTTTYATDYSGSKGQSAFQSAFQNVFGRAPVAGDQLSPQVGKDGKPITWVQALANEGNKPGNSETVTRSGQGKYVVTKGGFDAQAWMQGQLANYYRKGIQTGTLTPEQNVSTQYSNLASDYGINIYDPTTKAFNTSALNDLANLESKVTTLDTLKQGWSNSIIGKYPNLATQMGAGLTLRQAADPALKSISNILGIDPSGITLNDPLVQKYLTGDGKSVMPQYQYEQTLRQDPRWATSKDAQDNLSAVAMSMAKTFGVMG